MKYVLYKCCVYYIFAQIFGRLNRFDRLWDRFLLRSMEKSIGFFRKQGMSRDKIEVIQSHGDLYNVVWT